MLHIVVQIQVAVLPVVVTGAPAQTASELRGRLARQLTQQHRVKPLAEPRIDLELRRLCGGRSRWWDCLGSDEVLFRMGERLKVPVVLSARLAALGEEQVLRVKVAYLRSRSVSTQEINLGSGEALAVSIQVPRPPRPRRPTPWHRRWYVWALIGAGVAGAAAGLAVGLTRGSAASASACTSDYCRSLP